MDDLQEQYRQELHNQEVKSNMRTLKGFCWIFVGFTLIWLLAGVGFFDVNLKSITMAYGISVCMMLPVTLIYIKGNLSAGWIKYYFLASVSVICGIVMGFLSFHATLVCVCNPVPGKRGIMVFLLGKYHYNVSFFLCELLHRTVRSEPAL